MIDLTEFESISPYTDEEAVVALGKLADHPLLSQFSSKFFPDQEPDFLKNLLKNNSEDICEIYRNASDVQKKIIVDMVSEKQMNGEKIDANILVDLGRLCGIDFMKIEPLEKEE